jgi:hypothetical protein
MSGRRGGQWDREREDRTCEQALHGGNRSVFCRAG